MRWTNVNCANVCKKWNNPLKVLLQEIISARDFQPLARWKTNQQSSLSNSPQDEWRTRRQVHITSGGQGTENDSDDIRFNAKSDNKTGAMASFRILHFHFSCVWKKISVKKPKNSALIKAETNQSKNFINNFWFSFSNQKFNSRLRIWMTAPLSSFCWQKNQHSLSPSELAFSSFPGLQSSPSPTVSTTTRSFAISSLSSSFFHFCVLVLIVDWFRHGHLPTDCLNPVKKQIHALATDTSFVSPSTHTHRNSSRHQGHVSLCVLLGCWTKCTKTDTPQCSESEKEAKLGQSNLN